MNLQDRYDDLDNLIRNIDNAINEIDDIEYMQDYIDSLNYIKYDLENDRDEIAEKLEKEYKKEDKGREEEYWREVI